MPLSQGEIASQRESFVEAMVAGGEPNLVDSDVGRASYAERVLAGGMPMALRHPAGGARNRWFDEYLNLTLDREPQRVVDQRASWRWCGP